MEYYYMDDEKWKVSCKDSTGNNGNSYSSTGSCSKSSLARSVSQRSSTKKNPFNLSRSSSQKIKSSGSSSLTRNSSQKCSEFTRKCSNMAKEQKAKFYIVKRCITMLVSWKKNNDDS